MSLKADKLGNPPNREDSNNCTIQNDINSSYIYILSPRILWDG
jgi:hypothetical protein